MKKNGVWVICSKKNPLPKCYHSYSGMGHSVSHGDPGDGVFKTPAEALGGSLIRY